MDFGKNGEGTGEQMKRFDQYMQHFADLDGWFQTPAIAIWDSFLSYQQEQKVT